MSLLLYANKSMHTLLFFIFFFTSCLSWQQMICPSVPDLPGNHTWEEAFEFLGISWNPNGTLCRNDRIPEVPPTPCPDPNNPPTALSRDITICNRSKAYVRVYIPLDPPENKKLPLIVNLHGGDFVLFSAATVIYHKLCEEVAAQFPAVVVSVDYRHAPENRLPAAYYDALNALFWVQKQALMGIAEQDQWMKYADFSRVFLLGSSAGANIAYHLALRALDFDLRPLKIKGLLLNQGFFGGLQKTESETRLEEDRFVPLYANYVLWSLALPVKANRDHEFCNPISGGTYGGRVFRLPSVYIKGDYGDPLVGRSKILAQFLISHGVRVTCLFNEGGNHGIELTNTTAAQELYDDMKKFVSSISETKPAAGYSYASS